MNRRGAKQDYLNQEELRQAGVIIERIPEGDLTYKAAYRYIGTSNNEKKFQGEIVVQVWVRAAVEQAVKDRLHKERGWHKGWIFIDSVVLMQEDSK